MSGLGGMVMQGAIGLDQHLACSIQKKVPGAHQFMTRVQQGLAWSDRVPRLGAMVAPVGSGTRPAHLV